MVIRLQYCLTINFVDYYEYFVAFQEHLACSELFAAGKQDVSAVEQFAAVVERYAAVGLAVPADVETFDDVRTYAFVADVGATDVANDFAVEKDAAVEQDDEKDVFVAA